MPPEANTTAEPSHIPYEEAHKIMQTRLTQRLSGEISDTLLLCSHPAVYTVGRQKGSQNNILNPQGTPIVSVERGGNVTFHGPGQLVGYPIVQIPEHRRDIHAFLRFIEEYWIDQLQQWNITATRDDRNTGVWVNGKKIVAIGISLRRWVSWHGFALNINVDLSYYQRINPCGMSSELVTRLCDHTAQTNSVSILREQVKSSFFSHWKQWCR